MDFDVRVRLQIYEGVIHHNHWPSMAELATIVAAPESEVRTACQRLQEGRTGIVLNKESGELLFAAPFCAVPSPFQVQVGKQDWFAPCGWDAFGIVALLGGTGMVRTSCPCCAHSISIHISDGALQDNNGWMNLIVPARHFFDDIVFT